MQAFANHSLVRRESLYADLVYPDLRSDNAQRFALVLLPILRWLRGAGVNTLTSYAHALSALGIRTPRGEGEWRPVQVKRVLVRVEGKHHIRIPKAIALTSTRRLFKTEEDYQRWVREYVAPPLGGNAHPAE